MSSRTRRHLASILVATLLGGCSGGSGAGGTGRLNVQTPVQSAATARPQKGTAIFTVVIPAPARLSSFKAKFISENTKSITIAANSGAPVTKNIADCPITPTAQGAAGTTCTISIVAQAGSNTFLAQLWDAAGGTGNVLAQSSLTAPIVAEQDNPLSMTLAGVVASLQFAPNTTSPAIGVKQSIPVTVAGLDAGGATIIGPYDQPVTLAAGTPSTPALTISPASLPDSDTAATAAIAYDGTGSDPGQFCAADAAETPTPAPVCATIQPKLFVTGISVSPTSAAIINGNTANLAAAVNLSDGTTESTVTWKSSATTVATVDGSGVVLAMGVGTATITAASTRDPSKTATAAITTSPAAVTPSQSALSLVNVGQTATFSVTETNYLGPFALGSASCTAGNGTVVATVAPVTSSDGNFTVTAAAAGGCDLTITGQAGATASLHVSVTTTSVTLN